MTGPDYIKRYQALESKRADWDSFWEDLGRYVQPRKSEINTVTAYGPDSSSTSFLFDSTAAQSNMTLAMGQMSLVSPSDEAWFELKPPRALENDSDAIKYFREISTVLREKFAESNFYEEVHEMYLMRGGFGTASIFSSNDEDGGLYFRSHDIGTYVICEDAKGRVDTFGRRYPLTATQAVGEFGFDRLPEKIQKAANDPKKCDDPYEFVHFVQKRKNINPGASASERMPWESVHIAYDDKTIVRESGYESFPYHVTRYLRWSDKTTDPYGWCPGWVALPDIRQVNLLQKWMDVLAEVSAFPRTIAPASLEGEIDLRGAGVTYYDPVVDRAKPEEWATGGRYDVGKDRIQIRQAAIEEAYHVDLFKMFAKLDKQAQMSVREVVERSSEKLIQFSPTFHRMVSELFNPMIRRVTQLQYEVGAFRHVEVPESIKIYTEDGVTIFDPAIVYTSKIALALKSLENSSAMQTMEAVMPLSQVDPSILDALDLQKMVSGFARNTGLPEDWLRTEGEVKAIQDRRQELMEAQQEAEIQQAQAQAQAQAQPEGPPQR